MSAHPSRVCWPRSAGWPRRRWPWPSRPLAAGQAQNTLGGSIPGEARSGASQGYVPPTGPAPRTPAGKPDFSGVWDHPYVPDMSRSNPRNPAVQKGPGDLPYTAAGRANIAAYDPAKNGDYTGMCMPFGLMRSMNSPYPIQIMQNDRYVAFLFEQSTLVPRGAVQGRALEGPEPDLVRRVDRPVGRRHAGRGHRRASTASRGSTPGRSAQRQAAPGADASRCTDAGPHRLHGHRGRPGLLHEAVDQRAHVHADRTTR